MWHRGQRNLSAGKCEEEDGWKRDDLADFKSRTR